MHGYCGNSVYRVLWHASPVLDCPWNWHGHCCRACCSPFIPLSSVTFSITLTPLTQKYIWHDREHWASPPPQSPPTCLWWSGSMGAVSWRGAPWAPTSSTTTCTADRRSPTGGTSSWCRSATVWELWVSSAREILNYPVWPNVKRTYSKGECHLIHFSWKQVYSWEKKCMAM